MILIRSLLAERDISLCLRCVCGGCGGWKVAKRCAESEVSVQWTHSYLERLMRTRTPAFRLLRQRSIDHIPPRIVPDAITTLPQSNMPKVAGHNEFATLKATSHLPRALRRRRNIETIVQKEYGRRFGRAKGPFIPPGSPKGRRHSPTGELISCLLGGYMREPEHEIV